MDLVQIISQLLSVLVVIGQVVVIGSLALLVVKRKIVFNFFGKHAIVLIFIVALVSTLGSLFYSEVAGYEPCKLCWLQRIFMYPQVFLLGIALWKKDKNIVDYSLVLSVIGALIAGYHYLLQLGIAPELPCSAVGYSVACSKVFVMNFGYITIPLMALTGVVMLILLGTYKKVWDKNSSKFPESSTNNSPK